ncbi:MAG TPA: c-type cytochrome [Candidatus Acidoferrum sp.]|nr:c-type cytochrome [Candidatus Acidoferrum sp.]
MAGLCISATLVAWSALARQDGATSRKAAKPSVYGEIEKAPEKARAKRNPFEQDADAVPAGKNLFEQHCAECHGVAALGGKKGPSLWVAEIQSASPGAIFWILTNGVVRRGMPVWSKLPEPQRWQLVTYIKSLGVVPSETADYTPKKP